MVVVGNKTDLIEQEQVSIEQGNRFAKVNFFFLCIIFQDNGALFKLTSAKQGKGVEDMFEFIAAEISKRNLGTLTVQDGMKLSSTKNLKKEKEKGGCC